MLSGLGRLRVRGGEGSSWSVLHACMPHTRAARMGVKRRQLGISDKLFQPRMLPPTHARAHAHAHTHTSTTAAFPWQTRGCAPQALGAPLPTPGVLPAALVLIMLRRRRATRRQGPVPTWVSRGVVDGAPPPSDAGGGHCATHACAWQRVTRLGAWAHLVCCCLGWCVQMHGGQTGAGWVQHSGNRSMAPPTRHDMLPRCAFCTPRRVIHARTLLADGRPPDPFRWRCWCCASAPWAWWRGACRCWTHGCCR